MSDATKVFNPGEWDGDPEDPSPGVVEPFLSDTDDLCDRTFSSKREAFATGFLLGGKPTR
ncbi:MAG TPA: hypothetical protein VLV46_01140 [Gaiellaceae bacterium]|nr:hypothetical protein [Gaiellaceae bacterium]